METTFSKEGSRIKSYFAFFDLDHTLISAVSGKELVLEALKRGVMKKSDLLIALSLSLLYKLRLIDPGKAVKKMGRWVKGVTVKDLEKISDSVSDEVLIPALYKEALEEITMHKNNNAGLVILSSTTHQVCKKMSECLGFDDILCTHLEEADGVFTGRPEGYFCIGEEKALRLRQYCEINNSKLQDAWYYGDAISDIPALCIVGHPVCINPERKLEKIAKKKGWKIYYW